MNTYITIIKKEFKSLFRGGGSLVLSILLPLIIMPIALTVLLNSEYETDQNLNSPNIALFVSENGIDHNVTKDDDRYKTQFEFLTNVVLPTLTANYKAVDDIQTAFAYEEIDLAIYVDHDLMDNIETGSFNIKVIYNSSYASGVKYSQHVLQLIAIYSQQLSELRLETIGSSLEDITGVHYSIDTLQNAFQERNMEGLNNSLLATLVPTIIIGFISFGSMSASSELFILEKEKHTLESLLTTSSKRKYIVLGKLTVNAVFSVIGAICQLLSLVIAYFLNEQSFQDSYIYFKSNTLISMAFALLSLSLLAAILNALVYVFSKSNRSASAASSLLTLGPILLSYAIMTLSPSKIENWHFIIPFVGSVFATKMAIVGAINIPFMYLSTLVNLIVSGVLTYLIIHRYSSEKILQTE